MELSSLFNTIVSTSGGLVADITERVVALCRDAVNAVVNVFKLLTSTQYVGAIIAVIMVISLLWFPAHHVVLNVAQNVWTCTARPMVTNLGEPIMGAIQAPITMAMQLINIPLRFQMKFWQDMALLVLKCNGTTEMIRGFQIGAVEIGRGGTIAVRLVINATLGRDINANATAIAASSVLDGAAHIAFGISAMVDCYCAPCRYAADVAGLFFVDSHSKCIASNWVDFILEMYMQAIRFVLRTVEAVIDMVAWVLINLFGSVRIAKAKPKVVTPKDDFPWPNMTYILPSFERAALVGDALVCCAGDLMNDVVNSGLAVGAQAISLPSGVGFIGNAVDPETLLRDWRTGDIISGIGPVVVESLLFTWNLLLAIGTSTGPTSLATNMHQLDVNRLFDSYESACIRCAGSFEGVFPAANMGKAGLANNSVVQSLLIAGGMATGTAIDVGALVYVAINIPTIAAMIPMTIYNPWLLTIEATASYVALAYPFTLFPRTLRDACRGGVHFSRAIVNLLRDLPTYENYVAGGYFDCTINAYNKSVENLGFELNNIFDLLPSFPSCKFVTDEGTDIPRLSCSESLFKGNIGALAQHTFALFTTTLGYAATVSEHLDNFTAVWEIPLDQLFDDLNQLNKAVAGVIQGTVEGLIPLQLVEFTLPQTNVTMRLDKMLGIQQLAPFTESLLNSFSEFGRFTVRTIQHANFAKWDFDITDLQSLLYAQSKLVNDTVGLMNSWGCMFKSAMTEAGLPESEQCLYSPVNGICPLDIVFWCDQEAFAAPLRAVNQAIMALTQFVMYPGKWVDYALADPILCELETATARLSSVFSGINGVTVDLTDSWGTNNTLNIGDAISQLGFAAVKVGSSLNSAVLEIIHAIRRGTNPETNTSQVANVQCTNPETPIWIADGQGGGSCWPCTSNFSDTIAQLDPTTFTQYVTNAATMDPCSLLVQAGSACCARTGKCFSDGPCYDPGRVAADVEKSIGSMNMAIDNIFRPLGIVDTHLMRAMDRFSTSALQIWNAVMKGVFVAPYAGKANANSFGSVFANAACATNDLGWAVGHGMAVPISLVGRVLGLIASLMEPTDTVTQDVRKYQVGIEKFSGSIGAAANAFMAITADAFAFGLGSFGALIEGDTSATRWATNIATTTCAVEDDVIQLRLATRSLVDYLDLSGSHEFCEASRLLDSMVEMSGAGLVQIMRAISLSAYSTASLPTSSLRQLSIAEPMQAFHRGCATAGILVSQVLYLTVYVVNPSSADSNKGMFDSVGGVVMAYLDIWVSIAEAFLQGIAVIFKTVFNVSIVMEKYSSTTPSLTIAKAGVAFLRAGATACNYIWTTLASGLRWLADVCDLLFTNPASPLVKFVDKSTNVGLTFLQMIVGWATGNTAATTAFQNTLLDFLSYVSTKMIDSVAEMLDSVIFGSEKIVGNYGPLACLVQLPSCAWDLVESWASRLIDLILKRSDSGDVDIVATLQLAAVVLPEHHNCQDTLMQLADMYAMLNTSNSANMSTLDDAIRPLGTVAGLWFRRKVVSCLMALSTDKTVMRYFDPAYFTNTSAAATTAKRQDTTTVGDGVAAAPQPYTVFNSEYCTLNGTDMSCTLDAAARTSILAATLWQSLMRTSMRNMSQATTTFAEGMRLAGMSPPDIEYYVTLFNTTMLDVGSYTTQTIYNTFGDTTFAGEHAVTFAYHIGAILDDMTMTMAPTADSTMADEAAQWTEAGRLWAQITRTDDSQHAHRWDAKAVTAITWCGHDITTFAQQHQIGSAVDSDTFTGCTDDSQFVDDYGCPVTEPGAVTPPELCPTWCPDCTNPSRILTMQNPCPLNRRCQNSNFGSQDLLESMCDRLCGGPSTSSLFTAVCESSTVARDGNWNVGAEVWALRANAAANLANLFNITLSQQHVANAFDSDFITRTNTITNGILTADTTCTAFGTASSSDRWSFCSRKCAYHGTANTYASQLLQVRERQDLGDAFQLFGFQTSSELNASFALLQLMCTTFCSPADTTCTRPPATPLVCTDSLTAGMTCLATCDQQWVTGTDPIIPNTCTPKESTTCNAHAPSEPESLYTQSCSCPMNATAAADSDYCSCTYSFPAIATPAPAPHHTSHIKSFCPALSNPVFHFFNNINYATLSQSIRVKTTRKIYAVPQTTKTPSTLGSVLSIEYTAPTVVTNTMCGAPNELVELSTTQELSQQVSYIESCGIGAWQYDPVDDVYWKPISSTCVNNYASFTYTSYTQSNSTEFADSAIGNTICATWQLQSSGTECPPGLTLDTTPFDGACDLASCKAISNYSYPIAQATRVCTAAAHCARGIFDATNCISSPTNMTSRICGRVRAPLQYTASVWTPMILDDIPHFGYVKGLYDGVSTVSDITSCTFKRRVTQYHQCQARRSTTDTILGQRKITLANFLAAYGKSDMPEYDTAFAILNDTTELQTIVAHTSITFTKVNNAGVPVSILQTVTYASRTDFCSSLCPNDPDCAETMATGIDCVQYRQVYRAFPTYGIPGAQMWLCNALPNLPYISDRIFPLKSPVGALSTHNVTDPVTGIHSTYSIYGGASSCMSTTGAYFNNAIGYGTDDECIIYPADTSGASALTTDECAVIEQYTINKLKPVYTILADIGVDALTYTDIAPTSRSARSGESVHTQTKSTTTTPKVVCDNKVCTLPRALPQTCNRNMLPKPKASIRLAERVCTHIPEFPCDRCAGFRWIPQNSTAAYFDLLAQDGLSIDNPSLADLAMRDEAAHLKSRGVQYDDPAARLVAKMGMLHDLLRQYTDGIPGINSVQDIQRTAANLRKQQKAATPTTTKTTTGATDDTQILADVFPWVAKVQYGLTYLARTIELSACHAAPGSPPCSRMQALVAERGKDTTEYARRSKLSRSASSTNTKAPPTIRSAVIGSWYETVIPPLTALPTDCYVLCGYNYTSMLQEICVWRVFDRYGPVGKVWDALMAARAAVCYILSPSGDGSDRYNGGGPMVLLNKSLVDLNFQVYAKTGSWLDNIAIVHSAKELLLDGVGKILGARPSAFTIEELVLTLMAGVTHQNSSNITAAELQKWVTNVNLNSENEEVGMLYYLSTVTMWGADCPKVSGDLRLFGYIPIWNPQWLATPVWMPMLIWNATKLLSDVEMIVPDSLVKRDGGCRPRREISLPFSNECGCDSPSIYNCGEKHGFSDPLDSFLFIANVLVPSVAQSWFVTIPFKVVGMSDRTEQFRDVTARDDFSAYVTCFFITAPGIVWAIMFAEVIVITIVAVFIIAFRIAAAAISIVFATFLAFFMWQFKMITTIPAPSIGGGDGNTDDDETDSGDEDDDDDETVAPSYPLGKPSPIPPMRHRVAQPYI
jgi:hypothetical protein